MAGLGGGHHFVGVGQLGNGLGMDETGNFYMPQAGRDQPVDEAQFLLADRRAASFCKPSRGPTS